MRKGVLLITLFAVFSIFINLVSASSDETYTKIGTDNSNAFQTGDTVIDDSGDYDATVAGIGTRYFMPLVADLNDDGKNEIVYIDDSALVVKHYDSENEIWKSNQSYAGTGGDQIQLYDLDDDDLIDIILGDEFSKLVYFYEYNGSHLYQDGFINLTLPWNDAGAQTFTCDEETNLCLMVGTTGTSPYILSAEAFDRTHNGSSLGYTQPRGNVNRWFCSPCVKYMPVDDVDLDGYPDFFFSTFEVAGVGDNNDYVFLYRFEINSTGVDWTALVSLLNVEFNPNTDVCGATGYGCKWISSPVVADFGIGGNKEVAFAYVNTADEMGFRVKMVDSVTGGDTGHSPFYPGITGNFDGQALSNMFIGDFFEDTPNQEACVIGVTDDDEGEIVCVSEENFVTSTDIDISDLITGYDIFDAGGDTRISYPLVAHAVDTTTDCDNFVADEIITPWGLWCMEYDWLNSAAALIEWESAIQGSTIIPVDYEQIGLNDYIALNDEGIYYLDDGYYNVGAVLNNVTFNPCISEVIKVNTTMSVKVYCTDAEFDNVGARAILYLGETNEQDSDWSANYTSGTGITLSNFQINETTASSTIRVMCRDTGNPDNTDYEDYSFTVSTNGVEFGDTQCNFEFTAPGGTKEDRYASADYTPVNESQRNPTTGNNAIKNGIDVFAGDSGIGYTVIWLIVMAVAGAGVFIKVHSSMQGTATLAVVGIVEALLLIVGTMLGFISVAIIIIVVLFAIMIVGFSFRRLLTGAG